MKDERAVHGRSQSFDEREVDDGVLHRHAVFRPYRDSQGVDTGGCDESNRLSGISARPWGVYPTLPAHDT